MLDAIQLFLAGLWSCVLPDDLLEKEVGIGSGLFGRHVRLSPRNDIERLKQILAEAVPPGRDLLLHGERNPQIRRLSDRGAEKFRRGNADHGVDGRTHRHSLADHIRVSRKTSLPPGIAGDRYGMGARRAIVSVGQDPPQNWRNAQRVEVRSRHQFGIDLFEAVSVSNAAMHAEHDAVDGSDLGKNLVLLAKLTKEWIREQLPTAVGQIVHAAPPRPLAE